MLSHIAEWAGMVLAVGVVAGLVVLAAGAVGVWWLYRRLRRRLEPFTSAVAGYALRTAAVTAAARRGKLPPQVVYHLRRRLGSAPELE